MKKRITIAVALLMVLVLVTGCSITGRAVQDVNQANEPIKIGSILILTGDGAGWGRPTKDGIDLAVKKLNAKGGVLGRQVKVFHEDDQFQPQKAISAFNKLTEADKVDALIGTTWSHTGLPLIDLVNQKEIVMISPSLGLPDFNEGSKFLFNVWPHDELLSAELADLVFNKGHRKVGLVGAQEVWVKQQTNAFVTRFRELGGSIEVLVEPNGDDKDVLGEALKMKANKDITAVVFTTDGMVVGALVAKQMEKLGVELPKFSISIDHDTIQASEGAYNGMQFMTSLTPTDEFSAKFQAAFGRPPEIGSATGFDAVMLLAKAMESTGSTDSNKLQEYLNAVHTYKGASGDLTSDRKGGFSKPFLVKEVRNGKAVTVA